jgi:hypothetical protein
VIWSVKLGLALFEITEAGGVRRLPCRVPDDLDAVRQRFVPVYRGRHLRFRILYLWPGRIPGDRFTQLQEGDLHVQRLDAYEVRASGVQRTRVVP